MDTYLCIHMRLSISISREREAVYIDMGKKKAEINANRIGICDISE